MPYVLLNENFLRRLREEKKLKIGFKKYDLNVDSIKVASVAQQPQSNALLSVNNCPKPQIEDNTEPRGQEISYACKFSSCIKKFSTSKDLEKHTLKHKKHGNKVRPTKRLHDCGHEHSGKTLDGFNNLKQCGLRHNRGEKEYACNECEFTSLWKCNLKRHVKTVHKSCFDGAIEPLVILRELSPGDDGQLGDFIDTSSLEIERQKQRDQLAIISEEIFKHKLKDLDLWWPKNMEKLEF